MFDLVLPLGASQQANMKSIRGFGKRMWDDDAGAILHTEYLFMACLVTLGIIVGVKSVRDAIVTEFADYAQAICSLGSANTSTTITLSPPDGE